MYITFDEASHKVQDECKISADDDEAERLKRAENTAAEQNKEEIAKLNSIEKEIDFVNHQIDLPLEWRVPRDLSLDNVIGQIQRGVSTINSLNLLCEHMAFVSHIEPKSIHEALEDNDWINAMQEELNQFTRNDVWSLVPKTSCQHLISSGWIDLISKKRGKFLTKTV